MGDGDNNRWSEFNSDFIIKSLVNSIEKLCSTKKDRMLVRSISVKACIKIAFKYLTIIGPQLITLRAGSDAKLFMRRT